ncbi:MAG: glycine/betaine ABC transporter substrate-binding protein [Firmicutes bacterium HGW-Firmicutes-1]|jgi:osmoprotectant transport system substrate-binding protein/osmoprotectant transport system permease protein|nr:MAG: glycine/betaine ABC transporter substrate-binding protein [Firmicutes bacterium HGW-Firmicutes-1]
MFKFKNKLSLLFISAILIGALSGCSGGGKKNTEIVLLEGQFSEIDILMQMAGILIEENTDLTVTFHDSMNTVAAANALTSEEVDLYVSYDGTLLTTILGHDPSDVPEGEDLFEWTNVKGIEEKGLILISKFGFENTYALALDKGFAKEKNISTISELKPFTENLIFGAEHEFFDEEGTMRFNPFNKHYGIEWKDSSSIDIGLKYAAMDSGNIDVTMVYSTDGLNKKSNLLILKDDLSFFPQYYGSFLTRTTLFDEFADTAPNLKELLVSLEGVVDNETMIEMNYAVDAEGLKPYDVAKAFLVEQGLSK